MKVYSNENIEKKRKTINALLTLLKVILTLILVPIIVLNAILLLRASVYPEKTPDIFGLKIFVVASPSMEPEINVGDLIIVNQYKKAEVGDIITYKDSEMITHRVIEKIEENKEVKYKTKGDQNETIDQTLATEDNFEGTYICKLTGIGKVIIYLQNPFVLCGIVALLVIIYWNDRKMESKKTLRKQKRISYESKNRKEKKQETKRED